MEGNRKLRLLVTADCTNKCPMCCNNQFDFDKLPVVTHFDYDEIMITGGEPLLFSNKTLILVESIKTLYPILYPERPIPKIYVYTSKCEIYNILNVYYYTDGIVLTPHNKENVEDFIRLNKFLLRDEIVDFHPRSLRLNLFKDVKDMLPEDIDLSLWKVKDMEWIKDCPVPHGEDFRRLPQLWTKLIREYP